MSTPAEREPQALIGFDKASLEEQIRMLETLDAQLRCELDAEDTR